MKHYQFSWTGIVALLLLSSAPAWSQRAAADNGPHAATFVFLPDGMMFPPLAASVQEPRVGVRKEITTSRLKVDIGSTLDVVEYRLQDSSRFRMGIDFFTYALSVNSQGLRLQIDAVDGYFGGHLSFKTDFESSALSARLRLIHLSAHFLDGHFDNSTRDWKDGREPVPFTRDFGELTGAFEFTAKPLQCRIYSGFAYATLIRPTPINRVATLHGVELHSEELTGHVFDRPFNLFAAYHLSFSGINGTYAGTGALEFGVKLGNWRSRGLKLYASYLHGMDVFSQYYDLRSENWGLGFAFDFW